MFYLIKLIYLFLAILELLLQLRNLFTRRNRILQAVGDIELGIHDGAQRHGFASFGKLQGAQTFLEISVMGAKSGH